MTSVSEIVRCLKKDLDGDLMAGVRYAERISKYAERNPYGDPADAEMYAAAARILQAEFTAKNPPPRGWDAV